MQDVPRESVVDHLGLQFSSSKALPRSYGDDWRADLYDTANDDLDMQIAGKPSNFDMVLLIVMQTMALTIVLA